MACRISELVLGCRDPEVLARFWCEVLDFVVLDREEGEMIEIGPRLFVSDEWIERRKRLPRVV